MPRKLLQRYLPTPQKVRGIPGLKPLRPLLQNPDIWHLTRRSVAGAAFIGFFCCFLPIPFQMVVAGIFAVQFRCNLPLSIVIVWISNPLTMPPMFYFSYRLGAWLLNMQIEVTTIDISFSWLADNFSRIGYPLVFGSLLCGWVLGVTSYMLVHVLWRFHVITRWRERRTLRLARRKDGDSGSV